MDGESCRGEKIHSNC